MKKILTSILASTALAIGINAYSQNNQPREFLFNNVKKSELNTKIENVYSPLLKNLNLKFDEEKFKSYLSKEMSQDFMTKMTLVIEDDNDLYIKQSCNKKPFKITAAGLKTDGRKCNKFYFNKSPEVKEEIVPSPVNAEKLKKNEEKVDKRWKDMIAKRAKKTKNYIKKFSEISKSMGLERISTENGDIFGASWGETKGDNGFKIGVGYGNGDSNKNNYTLGSDPVTGFSAEGNRKIDYKIGRVSFSILKKLLPGVFGSFGLAYENIKIKNRTTEEISRNGIVMGQKTSYKDENKSSIYANLGCEINLGKGISASYNTSLGGRRTHTLGFHAKY